MVLSCTSQLRLGPQCLDSGIMGWVSVATGAELLQTLARGREGLRLG